MTRTYPHGVPSWIDLETDDVQAAVDFYGSLFGWKFTDKLPPEAPGRYVVASLDGTDDTSVAAIATPDDGPGLADDRRSTWNTYLAVDDVESSAGQVARLGGTVVTPPEVVGPPGQEAGRMARIRDPQGAEGRLWQAGTRPGAQRVNEPGTWNFSHLVTPEPAASLAFYGPLLGWEANPSVSVGMVRVLGYGAYLAATSDPDIFERQKGAPIGFADVVAGLVPGAAPARWAVTFTVADRDAAVAGVETAGGTVLATDENEWTREALVRDPVGAGLVLSQFSPQG